MPPEDITHLPSIPWVATLLDDDTYTTIPRRDPSELGGVWSDPLFNHTINTTTTLPSRLYQFRLPQPAHELRAFFGIGPDVSGASATLHGGVTAAMMYHSLGVLLSHKGQHCEPVAVPGTGVLDSPVTAQLRMKYIRRVVVPAAVVVYARMSETPRRDRWRIVGEMRDAEGRVCVACEGLYARVQARF